MGRSPLDNAARMWSRVGFASILLCFVISIPSVGEATTATVEEQDPKYTYTSKPSEKVFAQTAHSKDDLVTSATVSVVEGIDSNPLLDSNKKADAYTEEDLDMHFKYPLTELGFGQTVSKFGFSVTNVNYHRATDVNIFDAIVDAGIEQELSDRLTVSAGYAFELLWFPNEKNGTFVGNEINFGIRQKISDRFYQKGTYRLIFRNYTERKARLGNGNLGPDLRDDMRSVFGHELGIYLDKATKLRITNQFYINESNDAYYDYYDYMNYRVGASLIRLLTDRLYMIAGFYYQRREYDSRTVSDKDAKQRDNFYLATASVMYDITKDVSAFLNYSYTQNCSNEPLERYSDNLYSTGLHYSF